MYGVNLSLASDKSDYYNWMADIYYATFDVFYCDELMDYGDQAYTLGLVDYDYTA